MRADGGERAGEGVGRIGVGIEKDGKGKFEIDGALICAPALCGEKTNAHVTNANTGRMQKFILEKNTF